MRLTGSLLIFLTFICFCSCAVYNFYPSNTTFATTLNTLPLVGGDIVYFRAATNGGSYTYDFAAFAGTYRWNGQQTNPIRVRAFPGDKITLTTSNPNSNILQLSGSYWVFSDFEIIGHTNARGSLALRLMGNTNHVVVENLKIHDLYQNAFTANSPGADYNNITIRGNEVYKTAGTGECFYFGCQSINSTYSDCQMHDSLIENNYCHDTCLGGGSTACTGGSLGSGYQIKFGSYKNILRNNACFNTYSPCILLYDDFNKGQNLIEGNVVLNTAGDHGIQVSAGAVIRNNIVINSKGNGIYISNNPNNIYNNLGCRNIRIESNSFVLNKLNGIKFQSTPTTTVVKNNLVVGNIGGDFFSTSQSGVTWSRNAFNSGSAPPNVNTNGTFTVGATNTILINAAGFNVYPVAGSALINAGAATDLAYDFNNFPRSACAPTVGAYQYSTSSNPGWAVSAAFKQVLGTVKSCTLSSPCPITCSPSTPAPSTPAPTTAAPTTPKPTTPAPTTAAPTTAAPGPRTVTVSSTTQIINAINNVLAGDIILVSPGTYTFSQAKVTISNKPPATLKAQNNGTVTIYFTSSSVVEGFYVDNSPGWTFENLIIEGTCTDITKCENAFRVVRASDNILFKNLYLINFNSQIRVNVAPVAKNGSIVGCTFFDRVGRPSSTYKVYIDGGNGWTIRGNSFRGYFSSASGSLSGGVTVRSYSGVNIDSNIFVATLIQTSFGIFLKSGTGNSSIFNNIISTTSDVGIYLETVNVANIYNNILYNTLGIDSRFSGSYAIIRNNVYNGNLRDRDSATPSLKSNNFQVASVSAFTTYFNNPASLDFTLKSDGVTQFKGNGTQVPVTTDFCLKKRSGNHIGIFDLSSTPYGCSTTTPVNVANPNLRAIFANENKTTNSSKPSSGVAVYVIIAVCAFLAVTLFVVIIVTVYRKRQNQNLQNLEEPLLNK